MGKEARPLTGMLVRYALHGVAHLLELRQALLEDAATPAVSASRLGQASLVDDMAHASKRAVLYCLLNREFPSAQSMAKIGTRLWALVAARTDIGVFFKLNAGRVGLATTPSALARFADLQLGDLVLCCVSGVSMDGKHIYLDRYDHDWDYFDHQLRPSPVPEVGVYGREHHHRTTALGSPTSRGDCDPLLLRGLPATDEDLDAWDAEPEDLGLPEWVEE